MTRPAVSVMDPPKPRTVWCTVEELTVNTTSKMLQVMGIYQSLIHSYIMAEDVYIKPRRNLASNPRFVISTELLPPLASPTPKFIICLERHLVLKGRVKERL